MSKHFASSSSLTLRPFAQIPRMASHLLPVLFAVVLAVTAASAQQRNERSATAGYTELANHVPAWAASANLIEAVPADEKQVLTLVLARDPEQEAAYRKLLADQQDPASPEYHQWLTPEEVGERFGLSDGELAEVTGWMQSQGLEVDWISPARNFIRVSGAAADVGNAFQTKLNYYSVNHTRRKSIASAPKLPAEVAGRVKGIRGLYEIEDRPMSHASKAILNSTETTGTNQQGQTVYFVAPADFATIYNLPPGLNGEGISVGIVGRSRVDTNDLEHFREITGTTFADPVEKVPSGCADPGPAATSGGASGDQLEATLDVLRVGSIAQKAQVELVVSTSEQQGGCDIGGAAHYLVNTEPLVKAINISFGLCESEAGQGNVNVWDGLFSQAAIEGISVFVSSGDSGAAGCDASFNPPPANPAAISPNYICSSSYATCMGGTEFAEGSDPARYWSSSNNQTTLQSVLSYIPEGAWNEPGSAGATQVASSGGGVSKYIATPSWQTGTGVPAARTGRYTPDLAFSAAEHDGYLGCLEADGSECTNGSVEIFSGTSAAAPDMAGITALLDQHLGGKGQGNLNLRLYAMAKSAPSAFHDVTVASSGVTNCSVDTPSMCNNSTPGPSGLSGGQAGYLVQTGYDEATGWGSLDVANFINLFSPGPAAKAPVVTTVQGSSANGVTAVVTGTVNPEGAATKYWFKYGTTSTLTGAAFDTTPTSAGSGTAAVAENVKLVGLKPITKYYFQMVASNATGTSSGAIKSFTTGKGAQTIRFIKPANPSTATYGEKITLDAQATSGLAVKFTKVSGPATLSGSTVTIIGEGTVEIAASQAGNASWLAAPTVTLRITANKAVLTVTAENESMTEGSAVPALKYTITGLVNGNTNTAYSGKPALTTTATQKSTPKEYPITVTIGNLVATNYKFKLVGGTMTVKP